MEEYGNNHAGEPSESYKKAQQCMNTLRECWDELTRDERQRLLKEAAEMLKISPHTAALIMRLIK